MKDLGGEGIGFQGEGGGAAAPFPLKEPPSPWLGASQVELLRTGGGQGGGGGGGGGRGAADDSLRNGSRLARRLHRVPAELLAHRRQKLPRVTLILAAAEA